MPIPKQVPLHGRRAYISKDDILVARNAVATGGEDKPTIILPGSFDTVAVFDDFLGDLVGDEWAYVEGDTGMSGVTLTGSVSNGVFRLLGSETGGVAPGDVMALTHGLSKNWKLDAGGPKNGRLRMSVRLKIASVSRDAEGGRNHVFVGFSDSGGAEMPAYDTGAGVISNAADLVGFLFGPGADTGWSLIAAKSTAGDSGDQLVVAGASHGPTANVYANLDLEVRTGLSDTGGAAHFWINGTKRGSINSPIGSAINLTPSIAVWSQDTGYAPQVDIDYVAISQPRDTGL